MSSEKNHVPRSGPGRLTGWLVWLGLLILSTGLQWRSGAWQSDFGGHADEAAHVVTGLMVRDYLAGGFREQWHPVRYAEAYYERFPKVAIGHYPPGFYLLEALWLLPCRQPAALLAMMAALSATCGWFVWWLANGRLRGRFAAIALAVAFCLLPLVRTYTAIVMSDLLLVLLIGWATVVFARFLDSGKGRDAFVFGLLATAAILTKGGGLVLAGVPPLSILLTGRWRLLMGWRLWLAVIPVALFALPWMLVTSHITLEGKSDLTAVEYLLQAVKYYPAALAEEAGRLLGGLWVIGLVAMIYRLCRKSRRPLPALEACLWSLSIGLPLFFCVVPTGIDSRYLLPMFPAVLFLAGGTLEWLSGRLMSDKVVPWVVAGLAAAVYADTWRPVEKRYTGAAAAIDKVMSETQHGMIESPSINVLVAAEPSGEGALTAAAAFRDGSLHILRAGKVLASSDWLGRGYELKFQDEEGLRRILTDRKVAFSIIELPPAEGGWELPPHQAELQTFLQGDPQTAKLVEDVPSLRRRDREATFRIYRITP